MAALATAAVLVCVVCAPRSWLASALSVSPLRYLGRISYGLYLWHFPLFQWIDGKRTGLSGYALFGARGGATLAVATVSFYLVERPIRRGAFFRQWRAWVGAPAAVAGGEHHGGARHGIRGRWPPRLLRTPGAASSPSARRGCTPPC